MTVRELIEKLQAFDGDLEVRVKDVDMEQGDDYSAPDVDEKEMVDYGDDYLVELVKPGPSEFVGATTRRFVVIS